MRRHNFTVPATTPLALLTRGDIFIRKRHLLVSSSAIPHQFGELEDPTEIENPNHFVVLEYMT